MKSHPEEGGRRLLKAYWEEQRAGLYDGKPTGSHSTALRCGQGLLVILNHGAWGATFFSSVLLFCFLYCG